MPGTTHSASFQKYFTTSADPDALELVDIWLYFSRPLMGLNSVFLSPLAHAFPLATAIRSIRRRLDRPQVNERGNLALGRTEISLQMALDMFLCSPGQILLLSDFWAEVPCSMRVP